MGRAARANPRVAIKATLTDGPRNPPKYRPTGRVFDGRDDIVRQIRRKGKIPVALSRDGRAYAIDAKGTLRRLPVGQFKPTPLVVTKKPGDAAVVEGTK